MAKSKSQLSIEGQSFLQSLVAAYSRKTPTMLDEVMQKAESLESHYKDSKLFKDSYGNTITSIGSEDKIAQYNQFGFTNDTLNFWYWMTLYNTSWVFKKAIDKPAQDTINAGITLNCKSNNKELVYRELKTLRSDLIDLLKWGALFGGAVAVMMFDGMKDEDYAKELNKKHLNKETTMRLYVTDRWYGVSVDNSKMVNNFKSPDFGKPQYYNITFADGKTLRVHHSYILRYEHRTAPNLIKKGQLQGWGYAEGCHIINEISRDEHLKASIQSLVNKSLIEVIKMPGMEGVFMGSEEDNSQLEARLEMVNWARNFNAITLLDKEDEYQEHGFSGLGGLSDLLGQNMWEIAAALDMQGVLFGRLNNGFSQDDDAMERYDETIHNRAEDFVRPWMTKLLSVLYAKYEINEDVEFDFNSLLMKQKDNEKMESLKTFSELLSSMINDGLLTQKMGCKAMMNYTMKGIIDFGYTDENIKKIEEETQEQLEGIDIDELLDKRNKETAKKRREDLDNDEDE